MSDQERARTFVVGLTPRNLIEAESLTAALLAEFAAVRADERAAIVAWLRRTGEAWPTNRGGLALGNVARLIETGEASS